MENINEIMKMAEECLNCKNPLCRKGCPVNTRIPEFISKIKENDFESAYYILQENNHLSNVCSIVCPTERQCRGRCIKGIKGEPVRINELERFVNEWARENDIAYIPNCMEKRGLKIAVIGGGPAGISCCIELAKKGFSITIFEKESEIGGVLRYGIPDFRLSKDEIEVIENKIEGLGIEVKNNIEFGKDITVETLKEDGFVAIFLAIGGTVASTYNLSIEESQSIYKANEFLKTYNQSEKKGAIKLGTVAVIGGGNVAIDSARTSLRMGAEKVYILYRRDKECMPARKIEIEDAMQDGIEIMYTTKVVKADVKDNNVKEVTCIRTRMEDGKPIDIENSEFTIEVDNIIFAIGIFPDKELLETKTGINFDRALIEVDDNQMTNIPGVFAGGDLIETRSTVCRAIKTGKTAAENIEKYIQTK